MKPAFSFKKTIMGCPLADHQVNEVLESLPPAFSTLEFIKSCPCSGGDESGHKCPVVAVGTRSVCGRRLGVFSREFIDRLMQTNKGESPAEWRNLLKQDCNDASEVREPRSACTQTPPAFSVHSGLYNAMLQYQVRWKEEVSGVRKCGLHEDRRVNYLFPEDRWQENLLPEFRVEILEHLADHGIGRHKFAHHVLSSQCFALNLAAPFFRRPGLLSPLFGSGGAEVVKVEAEVAGVKNYFNEPGRRGAHRTSADLGIWLKRPDGQSALVLIEVKFTEASFGHCSKGLKEEFCKSGNRRILESKGDLCPLAGEPYRRTYWKLLEELQLFKRDELSETEACPFLFDGYQLMRNQLLAAAMERDPEEMVSEAKFVALLHDGNEDIRVLDRPVFRGTPLEAGWPRMLRNPGKFGVMSAREWITAFLGDPLLDSWAQALMDRYFPVGLKNRTPIETNMNMNRGIIPVRQGHRDAVRWMASDHFAEMKQLYDRVIGDGCVYFRPTEKGVVIIALDEEAPGYVGFRTGSEDNGHELASGSSVPLEDELRKRQIEFKRWLQTVRRSSVEERAVISWIRKSLTNRLVLPGMEKFWIFLNQEWRFIDGSGRGKKSDVLAVQVPTGRIGIIEVKASRSQRSTAVGQVKQYAAYWQRDLKELQPYFTEVLHMMGKLYGNHWAFESSVSDEPAALFFACPGPSGMIVEPLE
jgi:hypothetical protein